MNRIDQRTEAVRGPYAKAVFNFCNVFSAFGAALIWSVCPGHTDMHSRRHGALRGWPVEIKSARRMR